MSMGGGPMSEAQAPAFRIMGVVNVTPDSFSDGGLYLDRDAAVAHALELVAEGASVIGFGKTVDHNLELLARLEELAAIGPPIMVGTSRKSFLGRLTGREDPADRVAATVATCVMAYERGAQIFRVHDVAPVVDALTV